MQNELIELLSGTVKQGILTSAPAAKCFSIIIDCIPDICHVEQMTIIICFVNMVLETNTDKFPSFNIKEHVLRFVPLQGILGASLMEAILGQLQQASLPCRLYMVTAATMEII